MIQSLTARAPAKLIISGEHSVLYGQAAIAMAVDRYTTTTTTWRDSPHIHFKLLDLAYAKTHTFKALRRLTRQLQQDYSLYLKGQCGIRDVLKRPFELLQYSVSNLLQQLNLQLPKGVEIAVDSSIPLGCGMGSSASAVISTLYALTRLLNLNWQPADYLIFGKEIENLQHGKSSGLDLHLVTYGGCVRFQDGVTQARTAPSMPMHIVNTGKPLSTTGECVSKVAKVFAQSKTLANDFGAITDQVDVALMTNNIVDFKHALQANQRLLTDIGVVPSKVVDFIRDIEASGGAAKICGAGTVAGDNAGIVLLISDQDLGAVVTKHGYQMQAIQVDHYGTQII
jgi:mevalonate kinase